VMSSHIALLKPNPRTKLVAIIPCLVGAPALAGEKDPSRRPSKELHG
jgi:hypothetical protein